MNCKQCEYWEQKVAVPKKMQGTLVTFRKCTNKLIGTKDGFLRVSRGPVLTHGKFGCNYGQRRRIAR